MDYEGLTIEQIEGMLADLMGEAKRIERKHGYVDRVSYLPEMKDKYDKMVESDGYGVIRDMYYGLMKKKWGFDLDEGVSKLGDGMRPKKA